MKKSKKTIVNVRFDADKWEEIKKVAQNQGLSASAYIRKCVYEALKKDNFSFPPPKK